MAPPQQPTTVPHVMTLNANGLFIVTAGLEYKYCKIMKAASKLQLEVLMVEETDVNGLVDWHVRDVEQGAARYGFSVLWLHAKTYLKGGLMVLLRDDIQIDNHGPLPLTSPLDERGCCGWGYSCRWEIGSRC